MSKFFIERPVLANVMAIVIVLLGVVCMYILPVSEYPNIVPPTIQVTTHYPGASAATVANTVAIPIEQQVNGVEGSIYLSSTSGSDGSYTLTVTFAVGTDLNTGLSLVQNAVNSSMAQLPLVFIPAYLVPLFLMLHFTALFQARRLARSGKSAPTHTI